MVLELADLQLVDRMAEVDAVQLAVLELAVLELAVLALAVLELVELLSRGEHLARPGG